MLKAGRINGRERPATIRLSCAVPYIKNWFRIVLTGDWGLIHGKKFSWKKRESRKPAGKISGNRARRIIWILRDQGKVSRPLLNIV
jgi:hypothetical protein